MGLDVESLSEATSGAIGSLLSSTILYPLDTCKTKYQAEARAHGQQKYRHLTDVLWEAISNRQVLSLYQGLGTKNLQSFISQFVYFYGYSYFKRLYLEKSGSQKIGTQANLIIAAAAGACTAIVTQPLDTAASRMQTSAFGKSKGLWTTLSEGSLGDAFDGLGVSLLLTSNPAIQYTVFDQLKLRMLKRKQNKTNNASSTIALSALSAFVLGAVSKSIATCLTYPAISEIMTMQYTVFDQLKLRMLKRKQNKTNNASSTIALSALSAFVLGAVSKSIATCLTYPAIRCKVMIQAAEDDDDTNNKSKLKPKKTIFGVMYAIWKREGLLGFFKGLHAQILKTVLSSALLLMIKEKISATTWVLILALRRYLSLPRGSIKSA